MLPTESNHFTGSLPSQKYDSDNSVQYRLILDKLPYFICLIADDFSIRYANIYFNNLFGATNSKSRCYSAISRRNSPCNPCHVKQAADKRKEHIWTWEDALRGQFYKMHLFPFAKTNGTKVSLVLGIIIDEQEIQKKRAEQMGKEDLLRICCHCKNINETRSEWESIEFFLSRANIRLSHGICPDCLLKHYPEITGHVK